MMENHRHDNWHCKQEQDADARNMRCEPLQMPLLRSAKHEREKAAKQKRIKPKRRESIEELHALKDTRKAKCHDEPNQWHRYDYRQADVAELDAIFYREDYKGPHKIELLLDS